MSEQSKVNSGSGEAVKVTTFGSADDVSAARDLQKSYNTLVQEVHKVIVGQDAVIEQLLVAIFCRGHCLMVGVPGLAKTLLVNTLAKCLKLHFRRIQFTPDLMPSDITGTDVIQEDTETGRRKFEFMKGPLFTNILLADEINRTPPKTQAALLEAMQEHRVTVGEKTYILPSPFFILATQNPIEQEGIYSLPEAQLDRFMFLVHVDYPEHQEEMDVLRRTTSTYDANLQAVFSGEDIQRFQDLTRRVPVPEHVYDYAVRLTAATRLRKPTGIPYCKKYLSWGAGPRAAQYLVLGAKARCLLAGRFTASVEDVDSVVHAVLRHRIVRNFAAEAEGITADQVIDEILKVTSKHPPSAVVPL
ncbi:MAG: MoxR family ATPase [Planctomycetota bacterium]